MTHHLYNTKTGHTSTTQTLSLLEAKTRNRELASAASAYRWISDVARDYLLTA